MDFQLMEKRRKKSNIKKDKVGIKALPKEYIDEKNSVSYADIVKLGLQPSQEPRNAIKFVISERQEELRKIEKRGKVLAKKPANQNPWYIINVDGFLHIIKKKKWKKEEKNVSKEDEDRKILLHIGNIKSSTSTDAKKNPVYGKKTGPSTEINCRIIKQGNKKNISVPVATVTHPPTQSNFFAVGPISSEQLSDCEDIY